MYFKSRSTQSSTILNKQKHLIYTQKHKNTSPFTDITRQIRRFIFYKVEFGELLLDIAICHFNFKLETP